MKLSEKLEFASVIIAIFGAMLLIDYSLKLAAGVCLIWLGYGVNEMAIKQAKNEKASSLAKKPQDSTP